MVKKVVKYLKEQNYPSIIISQNQKQNLWLGFSSKGVSSEVAPGKLLVVISGQTDKKSLPTKSGRKYLKQTLITIAE